MDKNFIAGTSLNIISWCGEYKCINIF